MWRSREYSFLKGCFVAIPLRLLALLCVAVLVLAVFAFRTLDAPVPAPAPAAVPVAVDLQPEGQDKASHYLRAAHWFGSGWPVNFWNTDLESRAEADFRAIREDGFNAVVLVVPWRGFAPDPRSGALDPQRVQRLRGLMRTAALEKLDVVLRISFAWDSLSREPGDRLLDLWLDDAVHAGWLAHVQALWEAVGQEPNLRFGFFSWEDLWAVTGLAGAPPDARLAGARLIGFQQWLQQNHSLSAVAELYRTRFAEWADVPVPTRREPAFKLLLEFVDHAWLQRYFLPAQQRFGRLSMEVRIDSDPIWDGDTLLEWHSHESAWDLPGAAWTTLYWLPAMGGENKGEKISPSLAAERLQRTLERVLSKTGGRPIFIGQFLAEDYTPGFELNGRIPREQIGEFLAAARDPLQQLASGYGLWAWRDYHHDAIANPEFIAGLAGWEAIGDVEPSSDGVEIAANASITTALSLHAYHAPGGPELANICIDGQAAGAERVMVALHDVEHDRDLGRLQLEPGVSSRDCLEVRTESLMRLRFTADSPTRLQRIGSSGFVQHSGMRDAQGQPKPIASAYRSLNQALRTAPWVEVPLYQDGWMGRSFSTVLPRPDARSSVLRFTTHLPADWPVQPRLAVSIDGVSLGVVDCVGGVASSLSLADAPVGAGHLRLRIDSSQTHRPPSDQRDLACVISDLQVTPVATAEDAVK